MKKYILIMLLLAGVVLGEHLQEQLRKEQIHLAYVAGMNEGITIGVQIVSHQISTEDAIKLSNSKINDYTSTH